MNLDERQLKEAQAKKEEILKMQEEKQSKTEEESTKSNIVTIPPSEDDQDQKEKEQPKKKDKKKKKKKNKGLADFMEDETEKTAFEQETTDVVDEPKEVEEKSQLIKEEKPTPVSDTKPKLLMKPNEHSAGKNVKFDESKNIIKEFCKNEKIDRGFKVVDNQIDEDEEVTLKRKKFDLPTQKNEEMDEYVKKQQSQIEKIQNLKNSDALKLAKD